MKFWTLAVAAALVVFASDAALARGRRGCPGGNCYVGVVQAPVQKQLAKGEASPSDTAQAAEAADAPQTPVVTAPAPQRSRRFAAFRFGRRS